jgi:hypothetical protein
VRSTGKLRRLNDKIETLRRVQDQQMGLEFLQALHAAPPEVREPTRALHRRVFDVTFGGAPQETWPTAAERQQAEAEEMRRLIDHLRRSGRLDLLRWMEAE